MPAPPPRGAPGAPPPWHAPRRGRPGGAPPRPAARRAPVDARPRPPPGPRAPGAWLPPSPRRALEGLPRLDGLLDPGQRAGQLGFLGGDLGQALLRGDHGVAGIGSAPRPTVARSVAARSTSARGVSHALVWRSSARSAAARASRAAPERDTGLGQAGPGQLRPGGRLGRPALGLFDGGRRDDTPAGTNPPPRGRKTIPFGGDHHQVVASQGEIDRLLPPVDPHGPAHE